MKLKIENLKIIIVFVVVVFFIWNFFYTNEENNNTEILDNLVTFGSVISVYPFPFFSNIINGNVYNINLGSENVSGNSNLNEIKDNTSDSLINNSQSSGVNELHWEHMPITYFLDINTLYYDSYGKQQRANDKYEEKQVRLALSIIENPTENLVKFEEVQNEEDADLVIYGMPPDESSDDRLITEGKAGPTELSENKIAKAGVILYATKYSIITQNVNTSVRDGWIWESRDYNLVDKIGWEVTDCKDFPQVEIHEILHAFGFGHVLNNSHSVMAPVKHPIQTCKVKEIDKEIVSCLKHTYSNAERGEGCSGINMYPWKEETEPVDFKWDTLPITYAVHECKDVQKWNLQKAEKVIEKYVDHDIYKFQENGDAQINFYCGLSFDDVLLNKETDFWDTTVYFPSAQPYFDFENDKIKEVKIILFAQDRTCGGIEVHELLHGTGLREHYGTWMEQETEMCDTKTLVIGRESINKIKELYGLE